MRLALVLMFFLQTIDCLASDNQDTEALGVLTDDRSDAGFILPTIVVSTDEDEYNDHLQRMYLWARGIECLFKSVGLILMLENFDLPSHIILGLGCFASYFASWYQGRHGLHDLQLIKQGKLDPNSGVRFLAYLTVVRAGLNIVANTLFVVVYLVEPDQSAWFTMGLVGIATSGLGLIKNIHDTKKNSDIEFVAFGIHSLSRIPFLYSAIASAWNELPLPEKDKGTFKMPYGAQVQIVAMGLYYIGTVLHQIKTYCFG